KRIGSPYVPRDLPSHSAKNRSSRSGSAWQTGWASGSSHGRGDSAANQKRQNPTATRSYRYKTRGSDLALPNWHGSGTYSLPDKLPAASNAPRCCSQCDSFPTEMPKALRDPTTRAQQDVPG